MSSATDDERAFARIERCLASDDPALVQRVDALNRQFSDPVGDDSFTGHGGKGRLTGQDDEKRVTDRALDGAGGRSCTVKVAVALAIVAAVGLLLTAILSAPGGGERQSPQQYGMASPAPAQVHEDRTGSIPP
ncbi:hypothetical protein [Streptomyces viridochromogenes]|uniref:hypothetical protein n=1 Tax=Streptomyces viridochromogenes TaxID=1938 RepID=UPI00056782B6|nr:hypothetical protein [Streptomyces viridochromogenes]